MATKLTTLEDLLVDQLRDLVSAEKQIIKALPKMAKKASSKQLKAGFEGHLEQSETQLERLEQIADELGFRTRGRRCEAVDGLIDEAKDLMGESTEPAVLDAGLIAAAQKVEHYEIASYGCAVTWAQQLGHPKVAHLLQQTLDEEKATDVKLTRLAEASVNREAETVGAGAR